MTSAKFIAKLRNQPMPKRLLCSGACAAALLLASCGPAPLENEGKLTSYTSSESKADSAELFSVPQDQMAHIKVAAAGKSNFPRVLRFTGSVAYNAFKTTPVFSPVGGPVQEILVTPGQVVKPGQSLLTVTSPDYSAARSAYIKAKSTFLLADKNFERAKDLYEHKAIAERDLQQAESDRAAAQADLVSSEDALRAVGIKDPEAVLKNAAVSSGATPVPAPVGGEIVDRLVGPGQLLQAGTTQCFTISDMSTVWVLMNVYQNDLAYVHAGDPVEITTDAYPEAFHGKVSYIAAALDPATRTLQARIVTQNPGGKLKNNMYVSATVQAGAVKGALTVPDSAVLRDTENQPFVYVLGEQNKFARRVVSVAEGGNGRTIVTSGLKEGEKVAGDGALFLQFKNSLQH
jgi:membrane fusion protein, heavy metal efflux system